MRATSAGASVADGGDDRAIRLGFVAIVLAMLPAVLDQTILATALPTIATGLGRLADVSWVVSAYVVSAAAATPLWGKLGDRHGRKRLLEASLAALLAEESGAHADDVGPWIIANTLIGIHQALVDYSRRQILAGTRNPELRRRVRRQTRSALNLLAKGLADYGA